MVRAFAPAAPPVSGRALAIVGRDLVVVVGLVALAAVLRFVDLPARGTWDADQGHDMLVLHSLVRDGVVPLLGPPTSIGDVHHGAWYYYLLAPAAALSGADPTAVVAFIALTGIAAVAVTWWVAREIGGPVAGLAAGLVMAVSASAIEESTFIWNPSLVPLASSLALAGAWRAWSSGRARWWLLAFGGLVVTMQCHVLGVVLAPPFVALWLLDVRRTSGPERRALVRAGAGGLLVLAVGYLPLVVHELTNGFPESTAALAYLRDGGEEPALGLLARTGFIALRILAWPLTGLVTDALPAAILAAAAVVAVLALRMLAPGREGRLVAPERAFAGWAAATLAWCAIVLAVVAGSLATVTPGLPNDHYHAFLDPIVFVVIGLGAAALWRMDRIGRLSAVLLVAVLLAFNVAIAPPRVATDGGWPAALAGAQRIDRVAAGRAVSVTGLPTFKSADAVAFPLVHLDRRPTQPTNAAVLVVACDRLFEAAIGSACGGPAEDEAVDLHPSFTRLLDRFDLSPRTSISVYARP